MSASAPDDHLDALVVGGGFSGVYLLDRLREEGFDVKLVEAGSGLGGIWHWNCYPGARVDSPCWIYQYSREELWQGWDWSEVYPDYREMRAYFEHVDAKRDLSRDCIFHTRVVGAEFDEATRRWQVHTRGPDGEGTIRPRFFLMCAGFAAKVHIPKIDGLDGFAGPCHHTGLWPQDGVDLVGKRVGVLGTGASGVQVAQEAARVASHLTVFQRTPNLCLPMQQRSLDAEANAAIRRDCPDLFRARLESFGGLEYDLDPKCALDATEDERRAHFESLWELGGFKYWIGNYDDMLRDERANRFAYDFWRDKVRQRIDDPALAEKLAPAEPLHPFGCKRPSLEQWYYEIFNEDHVELVDLRETPIERATPNGLVCDGHEHALDVLVLATGFDAVTGGLTGIDIRGLDGTTLHEKWADGVRTYQGLANAGYPNLLVSYGPQAPTGFCNGPTSAEAQGDHIVECLRYLRDKGLTRIEATPESEAAWRRECLELVEPTLFPKADSWYMGANIPGKKREILMYPGGLPLYREHLAASVARGFSDYELS